MKFSLTHAPQPLIQLKTDLVRRVLCSHFEYFLRLTNLNDTIIISKGSLKCPKERQQMVVNACTGNINGFIGFIYLPTLINQTVFLALLSIQLQCIKHIYYYMLQCSDKHIGLTVSRSSSVLLKLKKLKCMYSARTQKLM